MGGTNARLQDAQQYQIESKWQKIHSYQNKSKMSLTNSCKKS